MKRGLVNENKLDSLLNYLSQNLLYRNTIDENIKKMIKEELKNRKLFDNIIYIINKNIYNKKTIINYIFYLMILSQASSNDEQSLFFTKELISLYRQLLIQYQNDNECFSIIVDYISQILIHSLTNQNIIINFTKDISLNLFELIYNNYEYCNSNSYFNFLCSFDKIIYSEETKKFQFLLAEKVIEELIKTKNDEKLKQNNNKIINIYTIFERLALSSSNEIIQIFFQKDNNNFFILDIIILLSKLFDELQNKTLYIIGNIILSDESEINQNILQTNAFTFLKEIITNEKSTNLNKKNVLWVMSNLCNDTIFYNEINTKHLFKDIIDLIKNINYIDAVKEGLDCFLNIILLGDKNINLHLINLGLFQCIFKIIQNHNDKNILKSCFNIILFLIEKGKLYENNKNNLFFKKFNEFGGEEQIQKIYKKIQSKDLILAIDNFIENYYVNY